MAMIEIYETMEWSFSGCENGTLGLKAWSGEQKKNRGGTEAQGKKPKLYALCSPYFRGSIL